MQQRTLPLLLLQVAIKIMGTTRTSSFIFFFFLFWTLTRRMAAPNEIGESGITPGLRSGLLFRPKGPLILATGVWTAVTRFQQQEVQKQAEVIRQQFRQIDQALQFENEGNVNQTAEGLRNQQFMTEMRRMWGQEKAWMEAELKIGEAEVRELRNELRLSRRARGLINALGDGLKWLFGTATEADTKRLHKDIKRLDVGVGKLRHVAELQATLIGTLTRNQKASSRNLAVLAQKAMDLEQSLEITRLADHITMRNIRREVDFSRALSSAIRTASAEVMNFHHEVKRITRALTHTQQGIVTTTVMPPATLTKTLKDIANHLPDGWVPALPDSATPAKIYKFLDLSAIPFGDGWEVHVRIPLHYKPYSQFHLYQVSAIPTHLPNSSIAFKTEIPAEYFAISGDQRLHIEAQDEDISRCRTADGHTMCLGLTPLINERREGCLYQSYRDNKESAEQECRRILVQPEPQIRQITEDKWLYVLPQQEAFTMRCAGEEQPTKVFHLQGTGVFSLPPACAALGDHYIVPAHLRRQSQRPEEIHLQNLTNFKIKIDQSNFEQSTSPEPHLNQTVLQQIINDAPSKNFKNPTLAELQERMRDLQTPTSSGFPTSFLNHTSLSLGAVSTIGLIGLVVFGCTRRRRSSKKHRPTRNCPDVPVPSAPIHPDWESFSQMQARLAHLESVTREMQMKMERIMRQEETLENLRQKCDHIAALV